MCVPKKSLPIRETSLAGKQDAVSMTPNSEKLFQASWPSIPRPETTMEVEPISFAADASLFWILLLSNTEQHYSFSRNFFHPPATPCDLAPKPEHLESDYVLQTPLSLMNQVIKPILMQTGVLPVTLVLFCAWSTS